MHKALITSVAAVGLMAPALALAQPRPPAASPPRVTDESFLADVSPWVVVGAAAIVGVALLETVPDAVAYLAVGALGGYLATVWYNGGQIVIRTVRS